MEAQSLVSHQHSWWFSCFSLREKLARSHKEKTIAHAIIQTEDKVLRIDFLRAFLRI